MQKQEEGTSPNNGQVSRIYTPIEIAVSEIIDRRMDKELVRDVEEYLELDVPEHFSGEKPILYLARHVASPNFETLRFVELAKPFGLPIVIGEDLKDKFVSNNSLKRSLCKLSIMKGAARNGDEIIECFTVVDFAKNQSRSFCEIHTNFGEKLSDFHKQLFTSIYPDIVSIVDESKWVDKYRSEKLIEQYKRIFALLIVHGIMFEWYPPEEGSLVQEIVLPAFDFVEKKFGRRPLICELVDGTMADTRNWESYPSVVYPIVKKKFGLS